MRVAGAERAAVALGPLLRPVGALRRPRAARRACAGPRSRSCAASRRRRAAGCRARGGRPAGGPARPRSRARSSRSRCAAPGRGAGRRAPAGGRPARCSRPPRRRARADRVGVLGQLRARPRSAASSRSPICAATVRVPVGVGRLGRQHRGHVGVHRGGRRAQPLALAGEVAADLVGVQVALGVEVADARRGQPPAVARVGHERLQHRDRRRGVRRVGVVDLDVARAAARCAGCPSGAARRAPRRRG